MKKIGILGSSGFLGQALCKKSKEYGHSTIEITRANYKDKKYQKYDILVNSATPSKKFWASQNPYADFLETVSLTADITYNWNYEKLVQISSMSVNDESTHHPYALNKKAAEIISSYKNPLIIRLSNLYGEGLNKGPLFDLLNSKNLYVDIKSEYSFISTDFVATWIFENLDKIGLYQIGAKDTISLKQIADKLGLKIKWEGKIEKIFSQNIESGMPSSNEVWSFINQYRSKLP